MLSPTIIEVNQEEAEALCLLVREVKPRKELVLELTSMNPDFPAVRNPQSERHLERVLAPD